MQSDEKYPNSLIPSYEEITQYLNISSPVPPHADCAIVFGSAHYIGHIYIAIDLYLSGIVDNIVLTGGDGRDNGYREALSYYPILLDAGVKDEAILLECHSKNTLQNVRYSLALLEDRIGFDEPRTIIPITHWAHERRCAMTLAANLPVQCKYYPRPYYPNDNLPHTWHMLKHSLAIVLHEYHSIRRYVAFNHLRPVHQQGDYYI